MLIVNAALSALVNLVVIAGLPFLGYFIYHKLRHKRSFKEIAQRVGLQLGESRYLAYSLAIALVVVSVFFVWPPPVDAMVREGSAFSHFNALGLGGTSILMALLYGVIKTGFCEELLFRGLIAGSLSRRLNLLWANVCQSVIFLLPHLLILSFAPEMWPILPIIFAGSLLVGWIRIKSDSIFGPWLIHAAANIANGLSVAIRTAG